MPILGLILIVMVLNAVFNGNFLEGVQFLFSPDFSQITPNTFLSAMGQAFFSMSLGMGAIMTYGSLHVRQSKDYSNIINSWRS